MNEQNATQGHGRVTLKEFKGNAGDDLEGWLFHAEMMFRAEGITDSKKKALLMAGAFRETAVSWAQTLPEKILENAGKLIDALRSRFVFAKSQDVLRSELDQLKQDGSVDEYVKKFQSLMNFIMEMSEVDKVHIFKRNLNPAVKQKLPAMEFATLDQIMSHAYWAESELASTGINICPSNEAMMQLGAMRAGFRGRCFRCGKFGHKKVDCKEENKRISSYSSVSVIEGCKRPIVEGQVNGKRLKLLVDTGAEVSALAPEKAKELNLKIAPSTMKIQMVDGKEGEVKGQASTQLVLEEKKTKADFIVTPTDGVDGILGIDWLKERKAIIDTSTGTIRWENGEADIFFDCQEGPVVKNNVKLIRQEEVSKKIVGKEGEVGSLEELVAARKESFATELKEIGGANIAPVGIGKIKDDQPISLRPYKVARTLRVRMSQEIRQMKSAGVIEEAYSEWCSPAVMINKEDGSLRFCVNYAKMNDLTETDIFPTPSVQGILDELHGASIFSTLDLKSGYWQIPLKKESRKYTAFMHEGKQYQFKVLPFGLKNAPAIFMRVMQQLLGNLEFVKIYLDDVIIHSKTPEEHVKHVQIVLDRINEAKLKINPKKCQWGLKEVKILGFIITENEMKLDTSKVDAIVKMPSPTNKQELQQILGLSGYYRKFIKNYAEKTALLTELLKKGVKCVNVN